MDIKINLSRLLVFYFLLISTFLTLVTNVLSTKSPNAFAYEMVSKGNKSAEFAENPYEWANMKRVLKSHKMKKLGSLCITGTFLLYSKPDYMASGEKEIRILSGIDSCISPGMALSIQLASSFGDIKTSSIVLFKETILKGRGFPVSKNMKNFDRKFAGLVNSLIINGKHPWTAYSTQGVTYCLMPTEKSDSSICMLLNLISTEIEKDNAFYRIDKGCDTLARTHTVHLSNCLQFGSGKLENIGEVKNGKINEMNLDVNTNSPIQDCNNNEELLTLLDIRMHHDFTDEYQMLFPKDKNFAWRTELLDSSFDITIAVCPEVAVNSKFLQILRELYIYLAEPVWNASKSPSMNRSEEVKKIIKLTDNCLDTMRDQNLINHLRQSVIDIYQDVRASAYETESLRKDFTRIQDFSVVMEVVWLIYNHVAALCHIAFDYKTNFWPDFSIMFHDMYLDTMKKHWAEPGRFQKYYQVLLGGYNIDQQIQGLQVCVTDIFKTIQTLEILPRPADVVESVSSKKGDTVR